ncbi:MAG: peptidoglycan DD-metalloendopeptidase family protein [Candidatus Peribacteria bacterium]|nr:peptidoglycan DD-metalloendopeptidase family protein [Candidatus Peribacteria bacterium]
MKSFALVSSAFFMVFSVVATPVFSQNLSAVSTTNEMAVALQGVKELKSGLDKVTQELFDLDAVERAKNADLDDKYRQARDEIVRVISSIDVATTSISQSVAKLVTYQKQMQNVVDELTTLRTSAGAAKVYLAEYLNLLYKMQLEIYEDAEMHTNDIRLLVNSDNISKTLVGSDITAAMTAQLYALLQQADKAEINNIELLSKLGKLKQQAQTTLNSYREEIEKLQQKKQYLLNFIELYKNEQVASAQRFDKVFASKKEVYLSIQTFLDEIVKKNYKSVDGIAENIAKLATMPDAKNEQTISPLARPVYPIEYISRYYNDAQFEADNGFKHQGIQIQAAQRSPVYAARDGVVYHVFDNMDSISWIMVVHQNGYVTIYQYLNQIIVKPGDIVSRGQIIGYS